MNTHYTIQEKVKGSQWVHLTKYQHTNMHMHFASQIALFVIWVAIMYMLLVAIYLAKAC